MERWKGRLKVNRQGQLTEVHFLVTTGPITYEGQNYALMLLEDITEIVILKNMLPICASCKKIRNDSNYWDSVEKYLKTHLDVDFTHSICPDCQQKLYPELSRKPPVKKPETH